MTGAIAAVQAAARAALSAAPALAGLSGVFDGPPARAAYPYVSLDASASDWSHKGARGREVRLALTVWDEEGARLHALMAAAEDAIGAIAGAAGGWRIASVAFLRSRVARRTDGPWAGLIEYRIRLIED